MGVLFIYLHTEYKIQTQELSHLVGRKSRTNKHLTLIALYL